MVHQVEMPAVCDVHAMFQRMLTGWAMDTLALRRRGLDRVDWGLTELCRETFLKAAS